MVANNRAIRRLLRDLWERGAGVVNERSTAASRRLNEKRPGVVEWGPVSVDLIGAYATFDGRSLDLQPLQLRILAYLVANAGTVVPATAIRERVLRTQSHRRSTSIARQISTLRHHFGKELISTIHDGYAIGVVRQEARTDQKTSD